MWPVVKDYCANACCEVVLVHCRATGLLLAYCHSCRAGWLSPADLEVNHYGYPSDLCPQGIEIPKREEVERSIWTDTVKRYIPEEEYSTVSETNESLARERERAFSQPLWQPPPLAKPVPTPRSWFNLVESMLFRILSPQGFRVGPSVLEKLREARERSGRDL